VQYKRRCGVVVESRLTLGGWGAHITAPGTAVAAHATAAPIPLLPPAAKTEAKAENAMLITITPKIAANLDGRPSKKRIRSAGKVGGNAAKAPTYCCSRCKETGGHNPRSCTRLM
jgi:hypothetical protein